LYLGCQLLDESLHPITLSDLAFQVCFKRNVLLRHGLLQVCEL
jgi:hypothetical protein